MKKDPEWCIMRKSVFQTIQVLIYGHFKNVYGLLLATKKVHSPGYFLRPTSISLQGSHLMLLSLNQSFLQRWPLTSKIDYITETKPVLFSLIQLRSTCSHRTPLLSHKTTGKKKKTGLICADHRQKSSSFQPGLHFSEVSEHLLMKVLLSFLVWENAPQ